MDYSSILSKPKSFFGKQKVWMARGEDLTLFNTHRPNIQNLLRHSCIPESSHNLWIGLYRVGATEEEAKTFVVVSCTDRRIRKLTRDILSSCPIFQPGQALDRFKVISKATLPETACEPRQTMQDEQDSENERGLWNGDKGKNIARDEYKTIRISPSITGDSYLCRQVQARHVSGKGEVRYQTATAGPLINVDGCTYQLTVAHVVNFETKDIHDTIESATDDWDEESDDDVNSGCSVDEDVASWDISASRNSTSDASDNGISSSLSSDSAFEVATQREGSGAAITKATFVDEEPIGESAHPPSSPHPHHSELPVLEEFLIDHASPYLGFAPGSENCQISTEMDYLLIPTNTDLQAKVSTYKSAELIQISEAFGLQGKTEPQPVIIATALLGYVEGVVFPASSLLRPPGSKNFQTLYCINSYSAMPKGTSGSAVFDRQTGLLAGYIVLGCPENNIWYMVPILDVLNDLEVRFHQKGKCQTRLDVTAATRLSDERGFRNEIPPGLLGTTQMCQGGSSILMKGEYDQSTSPRAYTLQALAVQLEKVAGYNYQTQLQLEKYLKTLEQNKNAGIDEMRNKLSCMIRFIDVLKCISSFNSELLARLDTFASEELHHSPDDGPDHSLWQGVYQETGTPESLQRIRQSLGKLRDTQGLMGSFEVKVQKRIWRDYGPLRGMNKWWNTNKLIAVMVLGVITILLGILQLLLAIRQLIKSSERPIALLD